MTTSRRIPIYAQAVFDSLHFSMPHYEALDGLTDSEWCQLIDFCHRTQLAIPFALRCADRLPSWVVGRLNQDLINNAERWLRLKVLHRAVTGAFQGAGLEFVTLKGFTHAPGFVADPRFRVQYDFDLLFPRDRVRAAHDVALELGYEPLTAADKHPVDHLPTLIRKTGWEWRGDYFDPDHPPALELHFRLWDEEMEGFAVPGLDEFWDRRERRTIEDVEFTSLTAIDLPGYASAHALRHLLRGDARSSHIYEIAYFLQHSSRDGFWRAWRETHDESLRRVEAICFAVAHKCFGCYMPAVVQEEVQQLPEPVSDWLAAHAQTAFRGLFYPTKDELWLHLSLLDPGRSRLRILRRRLLPLQLPGPVDSVHLPDGALDWRIRLRRAWRYSLFLTSRIWRHARALVPALWSGVRWAWNQR